MYRARDTRLQRDVAIKVLPERLAQNERGAHALRARSPRGGGLSHPNILAIHDVGPGGGTVYAVMELLEGATPARASSRGGPLPPRGPPSRRAQAAGRPRGRARQGRRAPRPQAGEPVRHARRPVKVLDFGLAARSTQQTRRAATPSRPTLVRDTDPGAVVGHRGLHVPGAGARRGRGPPLGRLQPRLRAARDADGPQGLRARHRGRDDDRDPARRPGPARRRGPRDPARARADRVALPREEARAALPVGARPGFRSRESFRILHGRCRCKGVAAPQPRLALAGRGRPQHFCWRGSAIEPAAVLGHREAPPPQRARFTQVTDLPGHRVDTQPLTRRQDARVRVAAGRRRRRLRAARGRPQPDQPHGGLRAGRYGAGLLAERRADRVPLRLRGRRRVRDGCHGRVAPQGGGRRPRPGLVSRRPEPRSGERASEQPALAPDPQLRLRSSTSRAGRAAACSSRDAVQPAWSPDGRRIAYWGLRGGMGGGGTRDIWTVAAEGGEPVDGHERPATSTGIPPGRPTAGSSTSRAAGAARSTSGACAIDTATGRTTGAPEPVTTPTANERLVRPVARGRADSRSSLERSARRSIASRSTRSAAGSRERPSSSSAARASSRAWACRPTASGRCSRAAASRRTSSWCVSTAQATAS